jgi:hypothetical protein
MAMADGGKRRQASAAAALILWYIHTSIIIIYMIYYSYSVLEQVGAFEREHKISPLSSLHCN